MVKIILFDGDCNFCDKSVQFIIKNDPKVIFNFTSLESEKGQELLKEYKIGDDIDSVVYIDTEKKKVYIKSTAALQICKHLKGFWKCLYPFLIIPRPIRNFVYNIIAKNRYKWFGKKDSCMLPTPEIRKRFL